MSGRHRFRTSAVAVFVAVTFIAAGCSSSSGGGGTAASSSNPACTGAPLKVTSIATLSGPLAFPSLTTEAENGLNAAVKAVNDECALGRPLDIKICDDKSDPNEATKCGARGARRRIARAVRFERHVRRRHDRRWLAGRPHRGRERLRPDRPEVVPDQLAAHAWSSGGSATAAAAGVHDALMVSIDSGSDPHLRRDRSGRRARARRQARRAVHPARHDGLRAGRRPDRRAEARARSA